jgi:heavy metal translocating P-type ATPase
MWTSAPRTETHRPTRPTGRGDPCPWPPWLRGLAALSEARWAAVSLAFFAAAVPAHLAGAPAWAWAPLYGLCYVSGGWEPGRAGLQALRNKTLDVDLLMIVAALGAAAIGQVLDGALLIVIFATSGALEAWATARTEESVRGLLDVTPDEVNRVGPGGAEELVPAAELGVGDVIAVRPGETIGADGIVVGGAGEVDQASISGEPLPVTKAVDDEVFAGTVNGTGALRVRVARPAHESVVARMAALVDRAARTKARTQLFIEKVEQRYSIGVVVATLVLFAAPVVFWAEGVTTALLRAMTFMIVASPCAVVLATMPPLLAAIANAGRHGVLVKSAQVMEQLASTSVVALDKTGTLTRGTPELTAVHVAPGAGWDADAVLGLAAAAEHPSEHPLARAVVAAARDRGLTVTEAAEFSSTPGRGVCALVGGRTVRVGSPAALVDDDWESGEVVPWVDKVEDAGETAVVVAVDDSPVAVLAISDELRAHAGDAVSALTAHTGRPPILITGDNARTARAVAARVGITDVRAGLLPEDKVTAIEGLRDSGERVLAVGDGVNDAPALAVADTGAAMGGAGADLTLHAAGVVIVRDELETLPALLGVARRVRRTIVANLVLAATIISALVVWDLVGHLPLPLGVAGHEGSTVLVGLNGLRLLRGRAWPRRQAGTATIFLP